jgi:hypothetical protein
MIAKKGKTSSDKRKPKGLKVKVMSLRPLVPATLESSGKLDRKGDIKRGALVMTDQYDPAITLSSSMSLSKSLLDPNTIYKFRLVNQNYFTASAGGVLSGYITFDPSGFAEYSTLSALFNEVRITRAVVHLANLNPHADGYLAGPSKFGLFVSPNLGFTAAVPGSTLQVLENQGGVVHHLASPRVTKLSVDVKSNSFAAVATPVPGPYAGCFGQFEFYQSGLNGTVGYFEYYYEGEYEFRSRT